MTRSTFSISILLFYSMICNAQTFKIKSLDGPVREVKVIHEVGDQTVTITSSTDTIVIDDFVGFAKDVSLFNESFLYVNYAVRSGSDQSRERLLLLCIKDNKLHEALNVLSLSTYDIVKMYDKKADSLKRFDEHGEYELKISLTGADIDHYKLNVIVHDLSQSKLEPKSNHNYNKSTTLNFDVNQGIFYNTYKDLSKRFIIYNPKAQKEIKQFVMGKFPTVELEENRYYYINAEWCEEANDDHLLKYTFR